MSRFTGPRLKTLRRFGTTKDGRTYTYPRIHGLTTKWIPKQEIIPGKTGNSKRKSFKKDKQYRTRLLEKQKVRYHYGLSERQLLQLVRKVGKGKGFLLGFLEMRLDCILFRLGLAPTITSARQIVNHGHICVNKKVVSVPGYLCQKDDFIEIKNNLGSKKMIEENFKGRQRLIRQVFRARRRAKTFRNLKRVPFYPQGQSFGLDPRWSKALPRHLRSPIHLKFDPTNFTATIHKWVKQGDVSLKVNERLILEYYSRQI